MLDGQLWSSDHGRAFAGYAPVLAAVGSILAEVENFVELTNQLNSSGALEAWGVIESVLGHILNREQGKLCEQLRPQISGGLPSEAYDSSEQLALLLQHIYGRPLNGTRKVRMSSADQTKYQTMVSLYIPEHPFVRQREFRNEVLGSVVIAYGAIHGLLEINDLGHIAELSRQPFLWRSFSTNLEKDALIDGTYLGYILNSFWNDPLNRDRKISIRSDSEGQVAHVSIPQESSEPQQVMVTLPITFYAQLRDADVDVSGTAVIVGHAPRGSAAVFYARGSSTVICTQIDVKADVIPFDGKIWFEANEILSSPRLDVYSVNDSEVGWGGQFAQSFPWNKIPSTLPAPYSQAHDVLTDLLDELSQRLSGGGTLALYPDFTPAVTARPTPPRSA